MSLSSGVTALDVIRSPKRKGPERSRASWFPYYAGFSAGFVEDVIACLDLKANAILLDPWLGAGTTSEIATAKGYQVRGYDLNPAMLLVARARTLATSAANQLDRLKDSVLRSYLKNIRTKMLDASGDPLEQWLPMRSSHAFRILERSVAEVALTRKESAALPAWTRVDRTSALVAFFYVALFRTLRHFLAEFQSSNPTWVKIPKEAHRIYVSPERMLHQFEREIAHLSSALGSETRVMPLTSTAKCVINQASSLQLPLLSRSVDAVVSSPPYCTRIDYVRATLPELAMIGYPDGDVIRVLREGMIGTPTVNRTQDCEDGAWGRTCLEFLRAVRRHQSKASSSYYSKYYHQYFSAMFASLREIDRVLKKSGRCVLVVQDSFYKDIRNDLPSMFAEMAKGLRWCLYERVDFQVKRTLAGINPRVRPYRNAFQATESALVFVK